MGDVGSAAPRLGEGALPCRPALWVQRRVCLAKELNDWYLGLRVAKRIDCLATKLDAWLHLGLRGVARMDAFVFRWLWVVGGGWFVWLWVVGRGLVCVVVGCGRGLVRVVLGRNLQYASS